MSFVYHGVDFNGKTQTGTLEVASESEAIAQLSGKLSAILELREGDGASDEQLLSEDVQEIPFWRKSLFPLKMKTAELSFMTRQIATMLESGISLVQVLEGLSRIQQKPQMQQMLEEMALGIRKGNMFWQELSRYPSVFNNVYIKSVRAGEESGRLDEILRQLAEGQERLRRVKNDVKTAMYYPVFSFLVAVGVVLIMLLKVLPQFEKIYAGFGAKLPLLTRTLMSASYTVRHYGLLLLPLVLVLIGALLYLWRNNKKFRLTMEGIILSIPLFGSLFEQYMYAQICRVMGILLHSGVHIVQALHFTADVLPWEQSRNRMLQCAEMVKDGELMVNGFRQYEILPDIGTQMIAAGEDTGRLDEMLVRVADFYEEIIETRVKGLSSLLEPLMIVCLGGVVAVMLIGMYLPIFMLGGAMRHH